MINGVDPTFEIDSFGKPKYKSESQTIVDALITLLFARPGCFPSMPNLGLEIQSILYSFWDDISESALKVRIVAQCSQLSSYINSGDIDVIKSSYNSKPLLIITIPLTIIENPKQIAVGITQDKSGEVIYNYQIIEE